MPISRFAHSLESTKFIGDAECRSTSSLHLAVHVFHTCKLYMKWLDDDLLLNWVLFPIVIRVDLFILELRMLNDLLLFLLFRLATQVLLIHHVFLPDHLAVLIIILS